MSYDRQIDQVCQHLVANEALYLNSNQRTAYPIRPIAAGAQVRLFLNGAVEVPSSGLTSVPSALGLKVGPYRIESGVNDTFQIRLNGERTLREVVLPSSARLTTDQIVRLLNDARIGVVFSNDANRVRLSGLLGGLQASIFVPTTSTLAQTLGITSNLEYRGKDLFPGWSLVVQPRSYQDGRALRYVSFDRPLPSMGDFVEITYTTEQSECRRCGGSGVENDWRYTSRGDVIEVRDEALLIQELLKLFYTEEGSNPFHPWYGTRIIDQIGQKVGVGALIQNLILADLQRAFARWQSIKKQQEVAVGQEVSDAEYPFRLLAANVEQSAQDPTVFFVSLTVQNRSSKPIQIARGIRVPAPEDLLGSTQQQGIFRESLQKYALSG